MNQIQFELKTPVKYSHEGADTDGGFITLSEPSIKQLELVAFFKTAFYKAAEKVSGDDEIAAAKEQADSDKKPVTADQIMALLYSHYPDMAQLFAKAKKLFYATGIASVEGVSDFNETIYQTMTIEDFERMIGEYLVSFILASALNQES